MSNRDKRRGADRPDGRRTELRLLEDETVTDRFDQRNLWSQERPSRAGRASHERARSRHYASGGARRPRAGDSGDSGVGGQGGEDWLLDERDRPDWDREDWRDRYRALRARSRWPLAFTATGVVVLFFGGLMLVQPPGTSGILGGAPCAAASCSRTSAPASVPARPSTSTSTPAAAPPSPAPSASVPATPSASVSARPSASASGSASAATGPTAPATSVSPALRFVHVSYSLVRRSHDGFQGQFTIVNRGRAAISDWRLTVVLPGDHVESAWDASFQETGDTVTLIPPAYALTIAAGAKVTEQFTATGTTLRPVSCTFSGAPC
jgi:hypothetical protein